MNRIEHTGGEGVADGNQQHAIFLKGRHDAILEGDFGRYTGPDFGSDAKALKIHKGPLQGIGELLEELLIGDTFLSGEKFQHGIL